MRRLGLAIALALVLSLCVTGLFYARFARQQAAYRAKSQKIIAADKDIQAGVPVPAASIKLIDWPNSLPVNGTLTRAEDVVGHVLIAPVGANEPIFQHDVASPGNSGLSAKIPDGLRAVAIKTNELNNLAGYLFPGSRIDVLATLRGNDNKSYIRTVLQNVQVLSAGEKMVADPDGKPENVKIVTVLVTPEESQRLGLAMEQGTIQLALRNQGDAKRVDTASLSVSDLENLPHKPDRDPASPSKNIFPKKAASFYVVETIAGAKSTVSKFVEEAAK